MSNVRLYKILAKGPKHFRSEPLDKNGNPTGRPHYGPRMGRNATGNDVEIVKTVVVGYAAGIPGFKDEILLSADEYAKLTHMRLVPVLAKEISRNNDGTATLKRRETIEVPDDWMELPADEKKLLASQIAEKDIKTQGLAEKIIASFYAKQNESKEA